MKIKLIRTGGFIPLTKMAEIEVALTEKELISLLDSMQPEPNAHRIKDGNYYEVTVGKYRSPVDIEKVPDRYKDLFDKLKGDLKIMKKD
jgi:hypothetical protein